VDDGFKNAKKLCHSWMLHAKPYEQEMTRQMFTSLDKITHEISTPFQPLHGLDNQFGFLAPSKRLDPDFDCNPESVLVDVSKEEFQLETQRLLNFIAVNAVFPS